MAVKRDERQKAEAAAFIEELYKRGGWATAADMAVDADVHQTAISLYRSGQVMPEGYNLLRLIKATARRVREDEVELALRTGPTVDLAEAVVRLEVVVGRLTEHLGNPPNAQGHGQRP